MNEQDKFMGYELIANTLLAHECKWIQPVANYCLYDSGYVVTAMLILLVSTFFSARLNIFMNLEYFQIT